MENYDLNNIFVNDKIFMKEFCISKGENKKMNIRNNKGISMITLIVTIIILVIIAGVSIQMVINTDIIERAAELDIKTEFSELSDEWNSRRAELLMKGLDDEEINYSNIKTATIVVGQTDLQERVIRTVEISDGLNAKIEIKKGKIVYKADMCTPEEIEFFIGQEVPEINDVN